MEWRMGGSVTSAGAVRGRCWGRSSDCSRHAGVAMGQTVLLQITQSRQGERGCMFHFPVEVVVQLRTLVRDIKA